MLYVAIYVHGVYGYTYKVSMAIYACDVHGYICIRCIWLYMYMVSTTIFVYGVYGYIYM